MESSVTSRSLPSRFTTHQTAYGVRAIVLWVALVLTASLSGQVAPTLKYKVLKSGKHGPPIAAMNTLADHGYRVLVWGPKIIMQLEARPPDTYRYMAMNADAGPIALLNWLNIQGAYGYRLTAGGVLEKAPDPRNYEYVTAWRGRWAPEKSLAISDLVQRGYHPVGLTMFFERELRLNSKPSDTNGEGEIQIADAMRTSKVFKQITVLAAKGYRYLGPYMSQKSGGRADLMQKCGQRCGGPFEYRSFQVHDIVQLTKELNELGKDGFRVVPSALGWPPHVAERGAARKETYSYHILPVKHAKALEQALNAPAQGGYEPIGYGGWAGVWTSRRFVILEKVLTASESSQQPSPEQPPSK